MLPSCCNIPFPATSRFFLFQLPRFIVYSIIKKYLISKLSFSLLKDIISNIFSKWCTVRSSESQVHVSQISILNTPGFNRKVKKQYFVCSPSNWFCKKCWKSLSWYLQPSYSKAHWDVASYLIGPFLLTLVIFNWEEIYWD